MQKYGLILLFISATQYGMEDLERPTMPNSNSSRRNETELQGSYEQFACCCLGSALFLLNQAYVCARICPNEQFPIFSGFGPERQYPIEYIQAAGLAEFIAVLCCCAHHRMPDHSCCAATAGKLYESYCAVCDSWARGMGWPICEDQDDRSWVGGLWQWSTADGLPGAGFGVGDMQVIVDQTRDRKNK
jgi:hypothetical protein